jgi:hypothetical protein
MSDLWTRGKTNTLAFCRAPSRRRVYDPGCAARFISRRARIIEGLKRNLGGSEIMPLYNGIRTRRGEIGLIEGHCAKLDEHQRHRPFSCAISRAMKS